MIIKINWCGRIIATALVLVMILGGIALLTYLPKTLVIKQGTENYERWIENETPTYTRFTLFNWTNPGEFTKTGTKPNFVEMGPYVFRQKHRKRHIKFNENNTVSYYQKKTWFFEAKMSNGSLDDMVTAPHIITAGLASIVRSKNYEGKGKINRIFKNFGGKLSSTHKVREMIFDGYNDRLLNYLRTHNLTKYKYCKFGYFFGRNASTKYDGKFTIDTGADRIQKLGNLTHWNDKINNGFYPGECGKINGSAGDLFPPQPGRTKKAITIYSVDTCRFLNLSPSQKVRRNGVNGFKWIGTVDTLDSGKVNPKKKCFCRTDGKECPQTGVADSRKCHNDWPIYTSFPHFYLADSQYLNNVTGLKPSKYKDEYSYIIGIASGRVLQMKARIQMNLLIQRDGHFDIYKNVPENTMMPLYFTEEIIDFNGFDYFVLKRKFGYALIILGGIIILAFVLHGLVAIYLHYRNGYQQLSVQAD